MDRLQQVLARGVINALCARELVVVSAIASDALRDELAAVIGPALAHLDPRLAGALRHRSGTEATGEPPRDTPSDEAVVEVVERLTERLMESDHVDDIFAEDRVIRRTTQRALFALLASHARGKLTLESERSGKTFDVRLTNLGYVVDMVVRRLSEDELRLALERAAAEREGRLTNLDESTGVASFQMPGGAEAGRLGIEEAITSKLSELVQQERVELPSIQQVLELSEGASSLPGFGAAIARAEAMARSQTGCEPCCRLVDDQTMLVRVTPMSEEAADCAETHFERFLFLLEQALMDLTAPESGVADGGLEETPPSQKRESPTPPSRRSRDSDRASRTRHRTRAKSTRKRAK